MRKHNMILLEKQMGRWEKFVYRPCHQRGENRDLIDPRTQRLFANSTYITTSLSHEQEKKQKGRPKYNNTLRGQRQKRRRKPEWGEHRIPKHGIAPYIDSITFSQHRRTLATHLLVGRPMCCACPAIQLPQAWDVDRSCSLDLLGDTS